MFTLSGGHVFPLYDAAHKADFPIVDVRHEQSAVFAAEAVAKLQRRPGLAVLTAGPGVTNGISGLTSAYFNGSPVLVIGGRAPAFRWGSGSLQEIDHVPLVASVTKHAATVSATEDIPEAVAAALTAALTAHRGPGVPRPAAGGHLLHGRGRTRLPAPAIPVIEPDPDEVARAAALIARARAPGHHRRLRRVRRRRRRRAAGGGRGAAGAGVHQRHGPRRAAAGAPARVRQVAAAPR